MRIRKNGTIYLVGVTTDNEVTVYEWRGQDNIIPFLNTYHPDIKELYVFKDQAEAFEIAEHRRTYIVPEDAQIKEER